MGYRHGIPAWDTGMEYGISLQTKSAPARPIDTIMLRKHRPFEEGLLRAASAPSFLSVLHLRAQALIKSGRFTKPSALQEILR